MLAVLWLAIAIGLLAAIGVLFARPWQTRWGATEFDVRRSMPGDDLVKHPFVSATRALTVEAPPSAIWPWVIELVQAAAAANDRHWLERLIRRRGQPGSSPSPCAGLRAGDVVHLGPPGLGRPLTVQRVVPGIHLLLSDAPTATWCFGLYPMAVRSTRLVVRTRTHHRRWLGRLLDTLAAEPGAFAVARQMLVGVRARAESTALRGRVGAPGPKDTASA